MCLQTVDRPTKIHWKVSWHRKRTVTLLDSTTAARYMHVSCVTLVLLNFATGFTILWFLSGQGADTFHWWCNYWYQQPMWCNKKLQPLPISCSLWHGDWWRRVVSHPEENQWLCGLLYRNWTDYVYGFGDLEGELWYGLENIHCLTTREDVELRIEVGHETTPSIMWTYQLFRVGGAETNYMS